MKKTLSVISMLMFLATSMGLWAQGSEPDATGTCGKTDADNVTWARYDLGDGYYKLVISGSGEMADQSSNNYNRDWGSYAELKQIATIEIGEGITRIGAYAFCSLDNLANIVLPSTLKIIGDEAFYSSFTSSDGKMAGKTIHFPAALDSIGDHAFYGCGPASVTYDFTACKNLKDFGLAFQGSNGTLILPSTVRSIGKQGTSNNGIPDYTYIEPVAENEALFINGKQMADENGRAEITEGHYQYFAFELKSDYYRVNQGTVTGEGCSLRFYTTMNTSYQLSDEFQAGMKAFSGDENAKVYIQVNPAADMFLPIDRIEVKKAGSGEVIPLKQETKTIYSFVMPPCAVSVSADFMLGGYIGGEADGMNVRYEIVDDGILRTGDPAYKMVFRGTGATASYSSNNQTKPWKNYQNKIQTVEFLDGITVIGQCLLDNTRFLKKVILPNTLKELSGYAFFNSQDLYLQEEWIFPETLEKIGDSPFRYTNHTTAQVTFDLSRCTKLKNIVQSAFEYTWGIKILPSSIETIARQAFEYIGKYPEYTQDNSIYIMVPEDKVMYLNGVQQVHTGDRFKLEYTSAVSAQKLTIEMRSGYHHVLNLAEVTGSDGSFFKFYGAYDGTNLTDEITANTKVHDDLVGNPVYVQFSYGNYKILDEDGLRVVNKRTGERVPLDTVSLADAIYSFAMPNADVDVSVDIVTGGYCGHNEVNNGYDITWRAIENGVTDEGKTTYKLILSGQGPTASFNGGYTPWYNAISESYYYITEVDVREGITALNAYAVNSLSGVKTPDSIHLPNSLEVIGGDNLGGMSQFEGTLVLPSGITHINGTVFADSSFDLDLTNCTKLKTIGSGIGNWGTQREGMRIALPESIETIEGQNVFYCSNVDLSRCTKLTNITQMWFNSCKGGEIILPSSMVGLNNPVVSYGGFYDCTSKLSIVVPDNKALYIDGQRMEVADGKADISAYMGQTAVFDWYNIYKVSSDSIEGKGCSLEYYLKYENGELSEQITSSLPVVRFDDHTTVYVKAVAPQGHTLFAENLSIKTIVNGEEQTVEFTQLADDVYSFVLPTGAVNVSAKFLLGGYCGVEDVNGGHDVRYLLSTNKEDDSLFDLVISGTGDIREGSPWNVFEDPDRGTVGTYQRLKRVEICEGVTNVPRSAFSSNVHINTLKLASTIKRIEKDAFGFCDNICDTVKLPKALNYVGEMAFYVCSGIFDFSECTELKEMGTSAMAEFGTYEYSESKRNVIILPPGLESLGDAFYQCGGHLIDMRLCQKLKVIKSSAFQYFLGDTVMLPSNLEKIESYAFNGYTQMKQLLIPVEEGTAVYANGQQVIDVDGMADLFNYGVSGNDEEVITRRAVNGRIQLAATNADDCEVKFYGAYSEETLADEIPAGGRIPADVETVYVSVETPEMKTLSDDGIRVKNSATGQDLALTTVSYTISSFTPPTADVNVTMDFILGGYCGDTEVNDGRDVIWRMTENGTMEDGTPTYKLTVSGNGDMCDYDVYLRMPWHDSYASITDLEVQEGVTSIGNYAFHDLYVTTAKLANSIKKIGWYSLAHWTKYEGTLVMPDELTVYDSSSFYSNNEATYDLDFSNCLKMTTFNAIHTWGGKRLVLPANIEEMPGTYAITCPFVDLSRCTKLTRMNGCWFIDCMDGEIILPNSMLGLNNPALEYGGFRNCTSRLTIVTPEDKVLFIDGQPMASADGKTDITDYMGQTVEFEWHTGYRVTSGSGITLYADADLTKEIPNGSKAVRDDDHTTVYVKATAANQKILFKDGLTVKTESDNVAVTQESDDVFSFIMPAASVIVTAQFTTGGYCGTPSVNNGHNLVWTLNEGVLAFQKNTLAVGNDQTMDNFANGAPWKSLADDITHIDFGTATSIGDKAFADCTEMVGLELQDKTQMTVGTNAFPEEMVLIVPADKYDAYAAADGWKDYTAQMSKDKETFTMKEGQQWTVYYSRVGRRLPEGLKAYTISSLTDDAVLTGEALSYLPAGEAVLIEHEGQSAVTVVAATTVAPFSDTDPTPVCLLGVNGTNLLQWLTEPTAVRAGAGYTLYKDEFVLVSSGTLPANIGFLPASGASSRRLRIAKGSDDDIVTDINTRREMKTDDGDWYTLSGKKLSGKKPIRKGLYVKDGRKVVVK